MRGLRREVVDQIVENVVDKAKILRLQLMDESR